MTLENQENKIYANLKAEKEMTDSKPNQATKVVKKMTHENREDDLGAKPKILQGRMLLPVSSQEFQR